MSRKYNLHYDWKVNTVPTIIEDPNGVPWVEVKKQLRQWYIDEASNLRTVTEKSYFNIGSPSEVEYPEEAL